MGIIDLRHGERYPEVLSVDLSLKEAIAKKYSFNIENIILNNGSNGSLLTIFAAMSVNEGKRPKAVLNVPNYFRTIHHLRCFKYEIITVKSKEDFSFPVKNYISAMLMYRPSLIVLTTPNNPVGKAIPDSDLIAVLDALPGRSIAVIDRTLINTEPEISTKKLLKMYKNKNIVILHSFSKSHNLSHERIGFSVTSNNRLASFLKQFVVLGLNVHAMLEAIKVMKKKQIVEKKIEEIKKSHKVLNDSSQKSELFYYPSNSGYALLKLPKNIDSLMLCKFMEDKGISLMGGHEFDAIQGLGKGYIRLYTGRPKQVKKFIRIFNNIK